MKDTRAMILELEANRLAGDELMGQVLDALKAHSDLIDEICDLQRYRSISRTAGASFIVEAMGALKEDKPDIVDILFGSLPVPAWHQ